MFFAELSVQISAVAVVQCPALQHLRVESERVEQSGSQGENIFWVSSQLGGGGGE